MRLFAVTVLTASLIATNLFAAEQSNAPLAPGQAAGVKKAQDADDALWWVLGVGAAIGIVVAVADSGGSNSTPATQ